MPLFVGKGVHDAVWEYVSHSGVRNVFSCFRHVPDMTRSGGICVYTCEDVISYVEEENVRFIRLAFCDVTGRQKNVTIMPEELRRAFTHGIAFDASAIPGFGDEVASDLFLIPDPSTLAVVPWHPIHGKMVRMYCSICRPDGSRFPLDSRYILSRAVTAAADAGLRCDFGVEFEFYLFKTDENGERTEIPFDRAGYMDIDPGDKCESIRREICFTLCDMGIKPESAHHEEGPGQNEIDFKYSDAMTAADNATTFKSVVRTIAARNGLYASFYPKPLEGCAGNGMHINISVHSADGRDRSDSFMAGLLERIAEMTAFLNPTEQSYKRLGEMKAPKYISWSPENRSQLIRIPAAHGQYKRIELRSPDPGANPYLALALVIYAGLDGIENDRKPMPPANINLFKADTATLSQFCCLPATLEEARGIARNSAWLKRVMPEVLAIL
jgi:glutamine synthetase